MSRWGTSNNNTAAAFTISIFSSSCARSSFFSSLSPSTISCSWSLSSVRAARRLCRAPLSSVKDWWPALTLSRRSLSAWVRTSSSFETLACFKWKRQFKISWLLMNPPNHSLRLTAVILSLQNQSGHQKHTLSSSLWVSLFIYYMEHTDLSYRPFLRELYVKKSGSHPILLCKEDLKWVLSKLNYYVLKVNDIFPL